MKAAVYKQYGPPEVLSIPEVAKPTCSGDDDVLVRVHAATVCAADWRLRKADPFVVRLMNGLSRPKIQILGAEFAGTVESVGKAVTRFAVGDAVFGSPGFKFGAHAEYVCVPEKRLAS